MSNIYVNSGIGSQLVMIPESTYGVAPTLSGANMMPFEFDSETLELKKTAVQGKGLHGGGVYNRAARRKITNFSAGGGITMDLPTRYMNQLLKLMTGSPNNPNAGAQGTLAQMGTTGVYSAVHAPGSLTGLSMCLQKGVPTVDGTAPKPFTYTGMKLTEWEVTVATGAIAKFALTWTGRNELGGTAGGSPLNGDPLNATVPALATFSEVSTSDVFFFREASIVTGTPSTTSGVTSLGSTTTLGNVKSASIKQTFAYDTARTFLGSNGFIAEPIENNYRTLAGQLVIEWLNAETMYAAFAQDTPLALQMSFVGPVIGTSGSNTQLLSFIVPAIYLDSEAPKISGPGVVNQNLAFTGLDDSTNNAIQITYQTVDLV